MIRPGVSSPKRRDDFGKLQNSIDLAHITQRGSIAATEGGPKCLLNSDVISSNARQDVLNHETVSPVLNIDNSSQANVEPTAPPPQRLNIKTRASNYMQQYNRGRSNSPVHRTRRLDPVQSIVSEVLLNFLQK